MQMAAHAIGPDHHDRADRIARGLQHIVDTGIGNAQRCGLLADGLFGLYGDLAPVTVQRTDKLAIGGLRPVLAAPAWTVGILLRDTLTIIEL